MDANQTTAKYVFLDIIGFSRNRSIEAQTDIIGWLNGFVRLSIDQCDPAIRKPILLPTGDGICIVILGDKHALDAHLVIALHLLSLVAVHNERQDIDDRRKFTVRIGLNQNTDNVVIDINGRRNIAGAGINEAQRIMDCADGGQVLVGASVRNVLAQRETYIQCFTEYEAKVKHDELLPVFQFVREDAPGLDNGVPSRFVPKEKASPRLTNWQAYYMMHCILHRNDFLAHSQYTYREGAPLLMHFLAVDSIARDEAEPSEDPIQMAWGYDQPIDKRLAHYGNQDTWLRLFGTTRIREMLADAWYPCFERILGGPPIFVNQTGRNRIAAEAPDIFETLQEAERVQSAAGESPPNET